MNSAFHLSVSVIVLTYKQPEILNLIVEALNNQSYAGKAEVIISDDGSPQSCVSQNRLALSKLKYPYKYVWQPDLGHRAAAARNNGAYAAKNDLLIFLDGDMVPFPELIEKHVQQHDVPNRLVAGNRTWLGEIQGIHSLEALWSATPEPLAIRRGEKENQLRHEWLNSSNPWRACFSSNLSVKKTTHTFFDERFIGWGPEDSEFSYRLCVKHGLVPVYDETIGAFHLEHPDAIGNVYRRNDHHSIVNYIKNTFLFYDSCAGLDFEDVFYGFTRLRLNEHSNTWSVVPNAEITEIDLVKKIEQARKWINFNNKKI